MSQNTPEEKANQSSLEKATKDLENLVKSGNLTHNISEVAMPGVEIKIDNTKK